jgi:hypothetical protein
MQVTLWQIDGVIPYARNAREIPQSAIDKVAASIREFGWRQPIVVDRESVIVAGHTRLLAARKLGLSAVPVHVADNLTAAQIKAYRLMDNRSHEEARWDMELLATELSELKVSDMDLSLTGFNSKEIDDLLRNDDPAEDVVPPLPDSPVTRAGDLWICGRHRVLCGDSTSPEAVARLLGDRKPFVMVTDPPYGIQLDTEWRDRAGLNGHGPAEPSYMKRRTEATTKRPSRAIPGRTGRRPLRWCLASRLPTFGMRPCSRVRFWMAY